MEMNAKKIKVKQADSLFDFETGHRTTTQTKINKAFVWSPVISYICSRSFTTD